jgi:hypothetical protein
MNLKPQPRPVSKAAKVAMYDANGRLMGMIDPDLLSTPPQSQGAPNMGTPKDAAYPGTRPVLKAKKKDQVAVYDANGNLVGTCDPDSITVLAAAQAPTAKPKPAAAAPAAAPADPAAELTKKALVLKKGMETARTVAEREQIATGLNAAAIVKLATIRLQAARAR